ncbi:hypothetical protein Kuja_1430 [Vibrio phage vB_VchM_Kuja]|uniref:Uncharacterized protein n=1 Tax=Vibrio phage vB_VchM_Kuja TaxID=2686437 RepID=A0A6B9J7V4_9CAUD|nr:hypothetical protein HWC83_gp093 [Vibrio phage vB_VchM_Kuja]QGZ16134.1 hypothetical protein Kuja_1430 [Vibrio phage vB_VchM_Kuja]
MSNEGILITGDNPQLNYVLVSKFTFSIPCSDATPIKQMVEEVNKINENIKYSFVSCDDNVDEGETAIGYVEVETTTPLLHESISIIFDCLYKADKEDVKDHWCDYVDIESINVVSANYDTIYPMVGGFVEEFTNFYHVFCRLQDAEQTITDLNEALNIQNETIGNLTTVIKEAVEKTENLKSYINQVLPNTGLSVDDLVTSNTIPLRNE